MSIDLNLKRIPTRCEGYGAINYLNEEVILRVARLNDWHVAMVATDRFDARGQTGIRVIIWQNGKLVYDTGSYQGDLFYGSPMEADDSERSLFSAIALICHGEGEKEPYPQWDYEGLEETASMLESEYEDED